MLLLQLLLPRLLRLAHRAFRIGDGADTFLLLGYGLHFGIAGVVKVYLGHSAHPCGETVHLFDLLSSAGTLSMPESRIDAMHKVASITRTCR